MNRGFNSGGVGIKLIAIVIDVIILVFMGVILLDSDLKVLERLIIFSSIALILVINLAAILVPTSLGWIALWVERKRLEEKQRIDNLKA